MPAQRIGKAEVVLVHLLSSHLLATAFTHINSNQHTNLAELTFYALLGRLFNLFCSLKSTGKNQ